MNVSRASVKLLGANLVGAVVSFVGLIFFAQRLGADRLGIYFLFYTLLQFLSIPADAGVQGALVKRMSELNEPGRFLGGALVLSPILLVLSGISILLFAGPINAYLGADLAHLLVVGVFLHTLNKLGKNVLKGEMCVGDVGTIRIANTLVYVCIAVYLIIRGVGVESLIYGRFAGYLVGIFISATKQTTPIQRPEWEHLVSLFDYAKYSIVSYVDVYLYNWLDVAVIGFFLTQAHVGAYETAWRITSLVIIYAKAIEQSVLPQVSSLSADGETDEIERFVTRLLAASLVLVIPAFAGTLLFSENILSILFGGDFGTAWLALIVLMGGRIVEVADSVVKKAVSGQNRPDLQARATITSTAMNIGLNLVLVPTYGLIGAAVATVAAFFLSTVIIFFYASKISRITVPWNYVRLYTMATVVMAVVLIWLQSMIPVTSRITLLALVGVGALSYGVVLLANRTIRADVAYLYYDVLQG